MNHERDDKQKQMADFIKTHYRVAFSAAKAKQRDEEDKPPLKTWRLDDSACKQYEYLQKLTKKQFGKDVKELITIFIRLSYQEAVAQVENSQSA